MKKNHKQAEREQERVNNGAGILTMTWIAGWSLVFLIVLVQPLMAAMGGWGTTAVWVVGIIVPIPIIGRLANGAMSPEARRLQDRHEREWREEWNHNWGVPLVFFGAAALMVLAYLAIVQP